MISLDEAQVEIVTIENIHYIVHGWNFFINNSLNSSALRRRKYNHVFWIGSFQITIENINTYILPYAKKFTREAGP